MTARVGVVGLGYFSQFHLRAWAALEGAELVGVADLDPGRAAQAAQTYGGQAYATVDALCAETLDVVDLVAPPTAHAALVAAAARPGRVVICQKPFCRSLEEAQTVTAAAEAAGATLVVHENFRFQPWHRRIKRFLDDGDLGAIYQARFALRPGDGRGPDAYLSRQPVFQTMPRLLIHETGVHFIDVFRWLLGDIASVYADLRRLNPIIAGEDDGLLILNHVGGARSVFDGNRLSDHVAEDKRRTMGEMEIEGEKGVLRLDGAGRLFFRAFDADAEAEVPLDVEPDFSTFGGGCVDALNAAVLAGWRGDAPFENAADEYLHIVAASEAAYRSAETGARVAVGG